MDVTPLKTVNVLSLTSFFAFPSSYSKAVAFPRKKSSLSLLSLPNCSAKPDPKKLDNDAGPGCDFQAEPISEREKPSSKGPNFGSIFPFPASSGGLVLDLGPTGSWDSRVVGSPVVKRFLSDEEERWYMWYHGSCGGGGDQEEDPTTTGNSEILLLSNIYSFNSCGVTNFSTFQNIVTRDTVVTLGNYVGDSIGLAVSSNGVHWERGVGPAGSSGDAGQVMRCGDDWWAFDTLSIRPSEVVVMSSDKVRASSAVYWLYYTGFCGEEVEGFDEDGSFRSDFGGNPERFCLCDAGSGNGGDQARIFRSLPGLAISQDGRHWARIEGEHHSGALFDVGPEGEWDSLFVASPQVVFHANGDLRMYYHSFDARNREFCIGVARSRDGIKWLKLGKVLGGGQKGFFDELGAMNASVVKWKRDGKLEYLMVYEGVGADGKKGIGVAVSSDGLQDWRRVQDEAVLEPSKGGGWDTKGVGSPCLVQMTNEVDEWRLYYTGVGDTGRTGIGMATSQGGDFTCFRRWPGFRL